MLPPLDGRTTLSKVRYLAREIAIHYHGEDAIRVEDIEYLLEHRLGISDPRSITRIFRLLVDHNFLVPAPRSAFCVRRRSSYEKTGRNGDISTIYTQGRPYAYSAYCLGPATRLLNYAPLLTEKDLEVAAIQERVAP